jgi:hypothetical protein
LAVDGQPAEALPYTIGLYAGQPESVPHMALKAVSGSLGAGEDRSVSVRFRAPDTNIYHGMHVFVRVELAPLVQAGQTRLLIDQIELNVEEGELP